MKRKFLGIISFLFVLAAVVGFPATAAAPGHEDRVNVNVAKGYRPVEPPDIGKLQELQPVEEGHKIEPMSAAGGYTTLYWQVNVFSCYISGGRVYIAVDGSWVGYVTRNGTFKVGKMRSGRYHRFYASDSYGYQTWGPSKKYIYSYWSWYKWSIACYS